jgi:hypothetical protein
VNPFLSREMKVIGDSFGENRGRLPGLLTGFRLQASSGSASPGIEDVTETYRYRDYLKRSDKGEVGFHGRGCSGFAISVQTWQ